MIQLLMLFGPLAAIGVLGADTNPRVPHVRITPLAVRPIKAVARRLASRV